MCSLGCFLVRFCDGVGVCDSWFCTGILCGHFGLEWGALVTYNLLSHYAFGQWFVFVGGFGSFSQSGSGIHSYVLCVGWAFHWQTGCDCCVACGLSDLLMAHDVLGLWWIVRDCWEVEDLLGLYLLGAS